MGELKQASFKIFSPIILAFSFLFPSSLRATDIILPKDTPVQVYFCPRDGCAKAITDNIDRAKSEVLVQAYIFTSKPIAKALLDADKRSVKVFIILDKGQSKKNGYSPAAFFSNLGIPTYIDASHSIAHDKIMIIDRETVITGSFNFTKSADTQNSENVLIIRSTELAEIYRENWMKHKAHADKYFTRQ